MKGKLKWIIPAVAVLLAISLFFILYFNIPRLKYTYIKTDDAYYVSKAYGNAKRYEVPVEHKGKPVIGIGSRAFYQHSRLEEVVIEENIVIIDRLAFSECKKLKTISLEHVTTIVRNAFSYCENLNDITISATNIGASAFFKCTSLNQVTLLDGVKNIGSMAFYETNLKDISLPRSVNEVGEDCFGACFALQNINVYGTSLKNNTYLKSLNIVTYIG